MVTHYFTSDDATTHNSTAHHSSWKSRSESRETASYHHTLPWLMTIVDSFFFSLRMNWSSNWLLRKQLIFIVINIASLETNSLHIYRIDDQIWRYCGVVRKFCHSWSWIAYCEWELIEHSWQTKHTCTRKHFIHTERHFLNSNLRYQVMRKQNSCNVCVDIEDRELLKEGTLKWSLNPIINFYWIITNFNENWLLP